MIQTNKWLRSQCCYYVDHGKFASRLQWYSLPQKLSSPTCGTIVLTRRLPLTWRYQIAIVIISITESEWWNVRGIIFLKIIFKGMDNFVLNYQRTLDSMLNELSFVLVNTVNFWLNFKIPLDRSFLVGRHRKRPTSKPSVEFTPNWTLTKFSLISSVAWSTSCFTSTRYL